MGIVGGFILAVPAAALAALALAVVQDQPAGDADHSGLVRNISKALAFQKACPVMVLDRNYVAGHLARAGISIAPLMPKILAQRPYHELALSTLDVGAACKLARLLYGENGTNAAGFLATRQN